MPSGCSLLMESLLHSPCQCNCIDLWRYSRDYYDHDHGDEGVVLINLSVVFIALVLMNTIKRIMVENVCTILFCVYVGLAV